MPNRLIFENSPYLLQHVNNPVDWYPWNQEALDRAVEEDKPIFLSVGYSACHWCHVMAHESFEDADTAAIMNEHFINIKVDREERPDIDAIYMNAVVALTGQGGWPMSVFLTPDTKPFYGGTYFPPTRRHNMPSFREILLTIEHLWREDRARLLESSNQITNELQKRMVVNLDQQVLNTNTLEQAAMRLAQTYDWENGGWGKAPKFPQPMAIRFLLRRAVKGDKLALDISNHALDAMARGGMYDIVGGGFARYSTDDEWLVPHFEKMLYDNALLARCYMISYLITGNEFHRQVCERTLDFLMREMSNVGDPNTDSFSGLYSSIDADSEGEEGKFYLWDYDEIKDIISQFLPELVGVQNNEIDHIFMTAYALTEHGNFEGKIVLQQAVNDKELAERFNSSLEEVRVIREGILSRLLNARGQRIRPTTDDKVIVAWNALAIIAFSEAARYLNRDDYLSFARQSGEFLLTHLHPADRLLRSFRQGSSGHNAYLEDIAALIQALVSLYQSDPDLHWINSAIELTNEMVDNYKDPEGGFYDTRDDHDELILRPKSIQDNATPSGNALAAMGLLQIAGYTGDGEIRLIAEQMLESIQNFTIRYPGAYSEWLCTLDLALTGLKEVVILGDPDDSRSFSLRDQLWSSYRPNIITAMSETQVNSDAPPLLHDRELLNNAPTAFVCENFVCKYPVNSPDEFALALDDK